MSSYQTNEKSTQCMTCKCGEGDKNIWTTRPSEKSDNQSNCCPNCEIFKSGPLFISSKGIGWTSWKKRWFVLSRKSLMFYRADPNALPQKESESPNPTLGGIELNNSGSVVVKTDKKLLTVLFPDGRVGRAFTLKTETLDELNEWKAALDSALAEAPSAAQVMGQNGIFRNEVADSVEASVEQCKDKPPMTSSIVGRPVLLALEDIDGSPSFLEKALRFIEEHGIKVEGILRQSADVEDVVRRVQEFEQGKDEFAPDEDAHVIGDCIKHVLREMPSSPVPASCCTALVDAYRTDRGFRVSNIRDAIYETFPEPNRRLLQRTLQMMLTVAAHKTENRMSLSALAACMAPLLLRPLLAGECELNNAFQMNGDGSFQLLQAAAAANHAQAIVIILLEEYEKIFDDESFSSELYTESEDEDIEDDDLTDNDIPEEDGYHDADNDLKADAEGDPDRSYRSYRGTPSGSGRDVGSEDGSDLGSDVGSEVGSDASDIDSDVGSDVGSDTGSDVGRNVGSDVSSDAGSNGGSVVRSDAGSDIGSNLSKDQDIKDSSTHSVSARKIEVVENTTTNLNKVSTSLHEDIVPKPSTSAHIQSPEDVLFFGTADAQKDVDLPSAKTCSTVPLSQKSHESMAGVLSTPVTNKFVNIMPSVSGITKFAEQSKEAQPAIRNKWGRTSARKNLSMESIEYISDDESAVQRLVSAKIDLQTKISKEIEANTVLQLSLVRRKEVLHEHRLALEKEVVRLREKLQEERYLRSHLESGLRNIKPDHLSTSACLDTKFASSRLACENAKDSPLFSSGELSWEKSPQMTNKTSVPSQHNESSSTKDLTAVGPVDPMNKLHCDSVNTSFPTELVDSKKQTRDSPSLQKKQQSPLEHRQCWSHQDSKIPLGLTAVLPQEATVAGTSMKSSTPRVGNSKLVEGSDDIKTHFQESTSSADKQTLQKPMINKTNLSTFAMNSLTNADSDKLKDEAKSSTFLGDRQSFQKLLPKHPNQSNVRSSGTSSSEDRRSASKKDGKWDGSKKDAPESPSARRMSSQKKQPSISSLNIEKSKEINSIMSSEEQIALLRNNATRRHATKSEEGASSSSTLTKLTNRLNFLKERRVQLANELQNLDPGRASGLEAPSKTNSS